MIAIRSVRSLDLRYRPYDWPFAAERRAEIVAHFTERQAAKPKLWNGACLQCRRLRIEDDVLRADYFQTDYATFLAWRDWTTADGEVFHCFGSGALMSADCVFMLGRMAQHTANAGRIYFPSGTPDLSDIVGDRVDLAASVARELDEEVGIGPDDYMAEEGWSIADAGRIKACFRLLRSLLPARELAARIAHNIAAQPEPELDAIVPVREPADLTDAIPDVVKAYLMHMFGQR